MHRDGIVWPEDLSNTDDPINYQTLPSVNTRRVTEELLRIHESNFCRKEGDDWEYGICASGARLGKTHEKASQLVLEKTSNDGVWFLQTRPSESPTLMYVCKIVILCIVLTCSFSGAFTEIHNAERMIPENFEAVLVIASTRYSGKIQNNFKCFVLVLLKFTLKSFL